MTVVGKHLCQYATKCKFHIGVTPEPITDYRDYVSTPGAFLESRPLLLIQSCTKAKRVDKIGIAEHELHENNNRRILWN